MWIDPSDKYQLHISLAHEPPRLYAQERHVRRQAEMEIGRAELKEASVRTEDFQKFKRSLFEEAKGLQDIGVAWGSARAHFRDANEAELDEMIVRALLELHDEGLILFYHAELDEDYNVDSTQVTVLSREVLRVAAVQLSHSDRQFRQRRLHDQVVVVSHQAVGIDDPARPLHDPSEQLQECPPVLAVAEHSPARVPARDQMVSSPRNTDSQRTRHA
jgi:hypothetical protein